MLPKVKDSINIHSYKHNKTLHRSWINSYVIESNNKQIVAVTDKTLVFETKNRKWTTKEPAICFFYPDKWFNIIAMIRDKGIFYYCNLASPSLYDKEGIKNIDYDLDVKVFPDGKYKILDENEFLYHSNKMNYPESIVDILEDELNTLIEMIQLKKGPFNNDIIMQYYNKYIKLKKKI